MMKYSGEPRAIWNWIHLISGGTGSPPSNRLSHGFILCGPQRLLPLALPPPPSPPPTSEHETIISFPSMRFQHRKKSKPLWAFFFLFCTHDFFFFLLYKEGNKEGE